jgi:hypothetical protein
MKFNSNDPNETLVYFEYGDGDEKTTEDSLRNSLETKGAKPKE